MAMKAIEKNDDDDIKVVVMNPECIPRTQEKLFKFFYEKHLREISERKEKSV